MQIILSLGSSGERLRFAAAEQRNVPIFLSIGYSTCHWCHEMAHECFEDHEAAQLMNQHCVAIKLDREERPDIDRVYMGFVQALHGQGGWPLSVWLTPDLQPIFGGTYFPLSAFKQIIPSVHKAWLERPDDLRRDARNVIDQLKRRNALPEVAENTEDDDGRPALDVKDALDEQAAQSLVSSIGAWAREQYDSVHGGFGAAPKFPQPLFDVTVASLCRIRGGIASYLTWHGRWWLV